MKDEFTKQWITENSLEVVGRYANGVLTLRGLYYQLVSLGMTNSMRHYKRTVNAMIDARRGGLVAYEQFSDRDRGLERKTNWETSDYEDKLELGKSEVRDWMVWYSLNFWENQGYYPEVWIEKKALIGTFENVCRKYRIALTACKGYPSLTFLNEAADRFKDARDSGKKLVILYFGDYDPSGEDIPRSIGDNLRNDFGVDVQIERCALMEEQVVEWGLPPAPVKSRDSRTANWDGLGQVELDAVAPEQLEELIEDSILNILDNEKRVELLARQKEEKKKYIKEMKQFVIDLADEQD